jgi:hypothetical protein
MRDNQRKKDIPTLPMIPAGKHQNATPRKQIVDVIIFAIYVVG